MRAAVICLAGTMLVACGATEETPTPIPSDLRVECPAISSLAPKTFALADAGRLPAIRSLLRERLDKNQVAALITALLGVLDTLDQTQLRALLAVGDLPALGEFKTAARQLLAYLIGEDGGPFPAALFTDLQRLVSTCDGGAAFSAFAELADAPELSSMLGDLGEILELDLVQGLLAGNGSALDRDGFTTLVCNVLATMIRPGFSVANDVIQPLSGIDLLPLGEPPISTFLRDLDALLSPERPVLPALNDLICCDLYGVSRCANLTSDAQPLDRDPIFTWTIHTLFTEGEFEVARLFASMGELVDDPKVEDAVGPLVTLLTELGDNQSLRDALASVTVTALEPSTARGVLMDVALLLDEGAVEELGAIFDAVANGCDATTLRSSETPVSGEGDL